VVGVVYDGDNSTDSENTNPNQKAIHIHGGMEHNLVEYAKYYSYGCIKISGSGEFTREIDHNKRDFLDISKHMLKINSTLNLKQLLKITPKLNKYLWQKLKLKKTQNVSKTTIEKQVGSLVTKVGTATITIDNHMAIIQVQIEKNTIENVLLNGGSRVNIITNELRLRLGLPNPKLAPYNLKMADQTTIKPLGLIKDLKIYVYGIPYITTFTILQNNMVESVYSMLGKPWLKDAKVAHDQGSNIVTI
jgi:hypothetical protein